MTKSFILSAMLLSSSALVCHSAQNQTEYVDQNTYMVELYKTITEFCRGYEKPSAILVAIPLDLIMVSGELPDEIQNKIAALAQAITRNEIVDFDNNEAMNLMGQIIPYLEIIDTRIASSIKELQKLGVRIIAISPFGPEHADAMLSQMEKSNLDFCSTALYKKDLPVDDQDGNCLAMVKNGVVFLNDYLQGITVLETLVGNASSDIEQLLFAAPMQTQANNDSN